MEVERRRDANAAHEIARTESVGRSVKVLEVSRPHAVSNVRAWSTRPERFAPGERRRVHTHVNPRRCSQYALGAAPRRRRPGRGGDGIISPLDATTSLAQVPAN